MRKFILTVLILAMTSACGLSDSHERVTEDLVAALEDLNAIMSEVNDEPSAEAAVEDVQDVATRFEGINQRMEALGDPDPEVEAKLKAEHEAEVEELMGQLMKNYFRIGMHPDIDKPLKERLVNAMEAADPPVSNDSP